MISTEQFLALILKPQKPNQIVRLGKVSMMNNAQLALHQS